MKYEITMERTVRLCVEFEADNDEEARQKAFDIFDDTEPFEYEHGYEEYDYAVHNYDTGHDVVMWC